MLHVSLTTHHFPGHFEFVEVYSDITYFYKGDDTRVHANLPQGGYESVDGKKLAKCTSVGHKPKDIVIKVRRTRVIKAIPSSPICWMTPCTVQ